MMDKETTSACFGIKKVEYEHTIDYIGYIGEIERAIWVYTSATGSAYCFSQGNLSKGIIAKFRVKLINNNQDAI